MAWCLAAPALAQTDFEWTGQAATGQSIEIIGVNGSIHAAAARGGNVAVTAVKTAGRSSPAEVRFETVPHAGGVTVCAIYPSPPAPRRRMPPGGRGRNNTRDNDTRVDFTVQVPPGIGLLARTVNGSMTPRDFRETPTGPPSTVRSTSRRTGSARATTVNESINASMDRAVWPNGAKFTTVNGGVTDDCRLR